MKQVSDKHRCVLICWWCGATHCPSGYAKGVVESVIVVMWKCVWYVIHFSWKKLF